MTRTFTPDEIETLITKLEALDGPNFEIENLICETLGLAPDGFERNAQGGWTQYVAARDDVQIWRCPAYTYSLDAAMRLMPPGYGSISMVLNERGKSSARLGHPYVFGNGATPAIALCIAALKARASIRASGTRPTGPKPDEAPPNCVNGSVGRDDVGGEA